MGGVTPLPTHPPLRFTREQTRVEYIRRCRLIKPQVKPNANVDTKSADNSVSLGVGDKQLCLNFTVNITK